MSEQKNDDLGKISLWLNDEGKTLASGKIQLFEQDGTITTLNVYIYENQKKGDSSPDYYGFIKQPQKKGIGSAPAKKGFVAPYKKSYASTDNYQHGNIDTTDDDDDTIAF
jgi:hypothetical protein